MSGRSGGSWCSSRRWALGGVVVLGLVAGSAATAVSADELPVSDLAIAVDDVVEAVEPGTQVTLTATITNAGPDPAEAPNLYGSWESARAAFVGLTVPASTDCNDAPVGWISCDLPAIAPGATTEVEITLEAKRPGPIEVAFDVTETAADDPMVNNDTDVATIPVSGDPYLADVRTTVAVDDPIGAVGDGSLATLTVHNDGPHAAADVVLFGSWRSEMAEPGAIDAPAGVDCSLYEAVGGWTDDGADSLACSLPEIAPGASLAVGVPLEPTRVGRLDVWASADYVDETDPSDDAATARISIPGTGWGGDLSVVVETAPDPTSVGRLFPVRVELTNQGPHQIEDFSVAIRWPRSMAKPGPLGPGLLACGKARAAVDCFGSGLDVGEEIELRLWFEAQTAGPFELTVDTGYWDDPDESDDDGAAALTIHPAGTVLTSAPRKVVAERGDGRVLVSWQPPLHGATEVLAYRVVTSPRVSSCRRAAGGELACWLKGLTNGETYSISMRARNAAGWSPRSVPIQVTPKAASG